MKALIARFVVVIGVVFLALPARAMDVQVVELPGLGQVWLVESHNLPIIAVNIAFRNAGTAQDADDKTGLSSLAAGLLNEGAGDLTSEQFQGRLEDLSIGLSFSADRDHFYGQLKTLTENREEAFRLLGLALTAPRFDQDAVDRVRNQLLAMLAQSDQQPAAVAAKEWYARTFPNHPYGNARDGEPDDVAKITVADLKALAPARFGRDNIVVSVVGDITADELKRLLVPAVAALPATADVRTIAEVTAAPPAGKLVVTRPIPQSAAVFGLPGIKRDDPDWFPAIVMNYTFGGGGFASRLVNEVREIRGLAYSVNTTINPLTHAGVYVGSVGTQNDRMKDSIEVITAEFTKMRDQGPAAEELDAAKKFITGSFPLSFTTSSSIAAQLIAAQLENFTPDYFEKRNSYVDAVTLDDVKRVAKRLLDPEALSWVVVGQPTGVESK